MHLNVIREAVDADLRQVHAGRAVDAQRHVEFAGGSVEAVEVGVIEVARLQRRRDVRGDEAEVLRLAHDVDRDLAVLDRRHRDAAQPAALEPAVVRDPLVVEPREPAANSGSSRLGAHRPRLG